MTFQELSRMYDRNINHLMIQESISAVQAPTGEPQKMFIEKMINEHLGSEELREMIVAEQYMHEENRAIQEKKRFVVDAEGGTLPLPHVSNTKLSHPFLNQLTNQKVNFLLAREFTISTENETYAKELGQYLGKSFVRQLKTLGESAITHGKAWLYIYYDRHGNMRFKRIPAREIIPFWGDSDHTILDALIHYYTIGDYGEDGEMREVLHVDYYDDEGVWKYIKVGDELELQPDMPKGHFRYILDEDAEDSRGEADGQEIETKFNRIPFICFRYNRNEKPLLNKIKSLIDEYDDIRSSNADIIKDTPNSIMVVKNYQGLGSETPEKDIGRFMRNMYNTRIAFVNEDGDVGYLKNEFEDLNYKNHAEQIRKNIYEFGGGIDAQEANFGHASGVAIRFRYQPIRQDCDAMANEFIEALEQLTWFIALDLHLKGKGDYRNEKVDFIFNYDAILNETETIANLRNSMELLSLQTLIERHPYVTDSRQELERIKEEQEERLKLMEELDGTKDTLGSRWGSDEFLESEASGEGQVVDERG